MTSLYKANNSNLIIAKRFLQQGKIACLPTETVYALTCIANRCDAIEKIYQIKNRAKNKAFAVFCYSIEQITDIAYLDSRSIGLINKFTPGPLTLVMKSKRKILADQKTIAVRIPNNQFTLNLLKLIQFPVIATSVNISGNKAATAIEEIDELIYNQIDLIIDGGAAEFKIPSTIIDVSNEDIRIIREGSIKYSDVFTDKNTLMKN